MALVHTGKVRELRVHKLIGYGPPHDHIKVHVVVELEDVSDKRMGFPLTDDGDRLVYQAWFDMLREAYTHGHTVRLETDFETEGGHNGIIENVTLV